jgi:hypothetical protein
MNCQHRLLTERLLGSLFEHQKMQRLAVPDTDGGMHHTMLALTGSSEYDAYIR